MVFLCYDCCVSSSTRQCDLLCYRLSFCAYFCVSASCFVYSVTICSSELSSIVSIVFPPSGQDLFHGLSGYAVAIVYIIHNRPVITGHDHRTSSHQTDLSIYPVIPAVSPVKSIMIHCHGTMNSRIATTSTTADAK